MATRDAVLEFFSMKPSIAYVSDSRCMMACISVTWCVSSSSIRLTQPAFVQNPLPFAPSEKKSAVQKKKVANMLGCFNKNATCLRRPWM